jgi:hypothetical protein
VHYQRRPSTSADRHHHFLRIRFFVGCNIITAAILEMVALWLQLLSLVNKRKYEDRSASAGSCWCL